MSVVDEIIARLERQQAANTLRGVRNESELICPHCRYQGPESEFDYADDSDKEDWETQDGETSTGGDGEGEFEDKISNNMKQNNPISAQEQLAQALLESAARNSKQPQQVNRPSQLAKPAQRARASNQKHAQEHAALVLAEELRKIRGEKK